MKRFSIRMEKPTLLEAIALVAYWIALLVAVLLCRDAKADDYLCQSSGFAGQLIGDTPRGPVVVTDANVYYGAYNDTQYIFSFLPNYNRIIVPLTSIVEANFYPADCTYTAEYDDDVFTDGFDGG